MAGWTEEYNAEYSSLWHDGVQNVMQSIHHGGMMECRVYIIVALWSAEYTLWYQERLQSLMHSIHHGSRMECRV